MTPDPCTITVIIGPSGAGKSTLVQLLSQQEKILLVRTVTTRRPRLNELEDTHEFVSESRFNELRDSRAFIGDATVYGNQYGLPRLPDSQLPIVVMLRAPFVKTFQQTYPTSRIIQIEAPVQTLVNRLYERGNAERANPDTLAAEIAAGRQLTSLIIDTEQPLASTYEHFARLWRGDDN